MPIKPEHAPKPAPGFTQGAAQADPGVLPLAPTPPFLFTHFRGNWEIGEVDGKPTWLPQLGKLFLQPGQSNVRATDENDTSPEQRYEAAVSGIRREGGQVIPRDASGVGDYVQGVPCKHPRSKQKGTFHCSIFGAPQKPARANGRWKVKIDREKWDAWRAELILDGVVSPPTDDELATYIRHRTAAVLRARSASGDISATERQRRLDEAKAKAAAVADADVIEPEPPAPKRSPRRRRPAAPAVGGEA